MNLKSGIFVLVALVACSLAAESNAQIAGNGFGRQAASRVGRFYVARSIGFPTNLVVRYAVRNTGIGQSFRGGNQRLGTPFGTGAGLQAGRLFRRF